MAKPRTKTTDADFRFFEQECRKAIKAWGIVGWSIVFLYEHLDGKRACIRINPVGRVASIVLSDDLGFPVNKKELTFLARHEVTHLLLSPLADIVSKRYLSEDEETAAHEHVCNHLEGLLP